MLTACAPGPDLASDMAVAAAPYRSRVMRIVEAQHRIATNRLAGNAADQLLLEALADDVKPALTPAAWDLPWLLASPLPLRDRPLFAVPQPRHAARHLLCLRGGRNRGHRSGLVAARGIRALAGVRAAAHAARGPAFAADPDRAGRLHLGARGRQLVPARCRCREGCQRRADLQLRRLGRDRLWRPRLDGRCVRRLS